MEEIPETAMNLKKTVGRRRIPIQKIENKQNRQVTFTKRRAGLLRKASELSTLCGSEIAVIVFSNAGKAYAFGNPSAESVFQRYVLGSDSLNSPPTISGYSKDPIYTRSDYDVSRKIRENAEAILWENRVARLGLNELKLYANYLQNIREIVSAKATSMASQSGYVADEKHMADLFVQDNDVNWEDIESAMADSPLISPDCFKQYEGESSLISPGGYVDSDVLPSSSSCLEVDTQFDSSLCDIQWEDHGLDLLASFLQDDKKSVHSKNKNLKEEIAKSQ
ncbi:hypothetical protein V2J09_012023 [Rumex salicifolius]